MIRHQQEQLTPPVTGDMIVTRCPQEIRSQNLLNQIGLLR